MLSSESTGGEITWSLRRIHDRIASLAGIQTPGSPPPAYGIFANQPSPYGGSVGSAWRTWLWLNVALAALVFLFMIISPGRRRFQRSLCLLAGE